MKITKILVLGVFLSISSVSAIFAAEYQDEPIRIGVLQFRDAVGKKMGPVKFKTKLVSEMQFDTNIFWTSNSKKSDTINVTSPSMLVEVPLGVDERHLVQMMYNADMASFSNYTHQNYINQNAHFNADFRLPFGYLNIQDAFEHTSDRAGTEFTDRVERTNNSASAAVGVKFNKLALETGYSNNVHTYDLQENAQLAYTEDTISETLLYQLFPKTKVLIEYEHGFINYHKDTLRNGSFDQVRVGLKGSLTGKTLASIKMGYQYRTYDHNDDFSGFVTEIGTITELTERTKIALTYIQGAQESTYASNNYYDMHYFFATLNQIIGRRFNFELSSGISRNIYPKVDPTLFQKRQDSILVEKVSLKYNLRKWAAIKVGYAYRESISTINLQSFNDHLFTTGLELQF